MTRNYWHKHQAEGRGDRMGAEQPRTPTGPAGGQVPNAGQLEQWAREGEQWVAEAGRYDTMFQPFGEAVLAAAGLSPGERVADVGCGNGALTIDAARRVGPHGVALGIDICAPMLDLARRRATRAGAGNVEFVEADAQVHPFGRGSLDAILSRFGVMFFDDPEAAFANLARACVPVAGLPSPAGRTCSRTSGCSSPVRPPPSTSACPTWSPARPARSRWPTSAG
jgi:SAM-dependent methyltransferase